MSIGDIMFKDYVIIVKKTLYYEFMMYFLKVNKIDCIFWTNGFILFTPKIAGNVHNFFSINSASLQLGTYCANLDYNTFGLSLILYNFIIGTSFDELYNKLFR
jgi:hypothetical protein